MTADKIKRFLKRYGRTAEFTAGVCKGSSISAMVTPLRYKNKMYLEGEFSTVGYVDGGHFLLIGEQLASGAEYGDQLKVSGQSYIVKKWDTIYLKETPVYSWAVLQLASE